MQKDKSLYDPNIIKTITLCSLRVLFVAILLSIIWLTKHSIWDFIKISSSFFYSYYTTVQYYILSLSGLLSLIFCIAIQRTGKDYTDTIKSFVFFKNLFLTLFLICGLSIFIPYLIIYFENKDVFEFLITSFLFAFPIVALSLALSN